MRREGKEKTPDRMADFLREKEAFERQKKSLGKQYQGKFVAIHGGRVVDSDMDILQLIRRFRKRSPTASVYIDKVPDGPVSKLSSFRDYVFSSRDPVLTSFSFIGAGRSGHRDISERHDEFLDDDVD